MERGKRQGWSSFFGGTGFYIALVLCVMTVGVAGYFVLFGGQEAEDVNAVVDDVVESPPAAEMPEIQPEDTAPAAETPAEEPVSKPVTVITPAVEPDPEAANIQPEMPSIVVAPLSGETVATFSMDALQYSETLGDWRTHDGVDIAAAEGDSVLAACAGTVRSVTDDVLMGTTVVLSHSGGYETVYANLQADPPVAEGDSVSAGQMIGAVGTTAAAESAQGAHLHFGVTRDGEAVDPDVFLNQ